jgi:hypothetical protein
MNNIQISENKEELTLTTIDIADMIWKCRTGRF